MKKLALIFAVLMAFSLPALAQHRGGGGGGHWGGGREPHEHTQAIRQYHQAYRGHGSPEIRDHWDGRRFDRAYFGAHWGYGHQFYWYHCRWWGPRFVVGSRFYYGGAWFMIVDPIPDYWGDGYVYIDDIDGVYYLVNPLYPGTHIVVNVVF